MQCAGDNAMLYDEWWVDGPNAGQFGLLAQRVDGLRLDSYGYWPKELMDLHKIVRVIDPKKERLTG